MSLFKFEVCSNGLESCIAAQRGGADRVELCAGIPEGGTTPSYGEIKCAREIPGIGLNVIIRPRGGDFLYDEREKKIMLEDIRMARSLGVDGLVFGCLDKDGNVDRPMLAELLNASGDTPVTFHRAFDCCNDPFKALDVLEECGVARVLTSGQAPTALEGASLLSELRKYRDEKGMRIIIMAGCGVTEYNIEEIYRKTGVREYHFSARHSVQSRMAFHNDSVAMSRESKGEYVRDITSEERVHATISALYANK